MKTAQVSKLSPMDRLVYWMRERESIRLKKEAGEPKPWTDDEILQQYRFCNVRRMDDKVSQWFLKNWYGPYYDHPNMLVACCLARQFNNTEAIEAIGFPERWEPERVDDLLNQRAEQGLTNFGSAYMITGIYGGSKVSQVVWKFIDPIYHKHLRVDTSSMRAAWCQIVGLPGFRSFIAGQVVADLRWAMDGRWRDMLIWAPMGPGSIRGIHRLYDRWIAKPIKEEQFLSELRAIIDYGKAKLPRSITSRMEAHDWQNCLCETDKYVRALLGEGHPKQRYSGR
jgi:hypothetical protein